MIALYTLVHLVHFFCTIDVIQLYNDVIVQWCNISLLSSVSTYIYINRISNGLVEKKMDELRLNFFPQISLLGKISKFPCES